MNVRWNTTLDESYGSNTPNVWRTDVEDAVKDFLNVTALARDPIPGVEITVEYLAAPHVPPLRLPRGTMAVYGFWHDGVWLKIGKAGQNSHARYAFQHYNGGAQSTLAGSLKSDLQMATVVGSDPLGVNEWMLASTSRVNILLPASRGLKLLSLLEAFLHLRLQPRYEG